MKSKKKLRIPYYIMAFLHVFLFLLGGSYGICMIRDEKNAGFVAMCIFFIVDSIVMSIYSIDYMIINEEIKDDIET